MTSGTVVKRNKSRGMRLLQLFVVIVILAVVGVSFGQNVLSPKDSTGVPTRLGALELTGSVEGAEALEQVNRLHGLNIELESAYIADYGRGVTQVTVWVGSTENSQAGAELMGRMVTAIARGGSTFSNLQRLTIADQEVFRVDGPGGEHIFYNSQTGREKVVWLIIESGDALAILEEALKTF